MPFFGLGERLRDSLWLLQEVADEMGLTVEVDQDEWDSALRKEHEDHRISGKVKAEVLERNALDVELHRFAAGLFGKRMKAAKAKRGFSVKSVRVASPSDGIVARCVSGLCSDSPLDGYEVLSTATNDTTADGGALAEKEPSQKEPSVLDLGESLSWQGLEEEMAECDFGAGAGEGAALGSFSWYNEHGGCVHNYDWYHRNAYRVEGTGDRSFTTRALFPYRNLEVGGYVVAIGDASTMGVYLPQTYLSHVEFTLRMPTVSIAYGKVGAGFFVDLLETRRSSVAGSIVAELLRGARVVVVQTMSVRAEKNALCRNRCGTTTCADGETFEDALSAASDAKRAEAMKESREAWISSHVRLLELAGEVREESVARSVVLLSFASPKEEVTEEMVDRVVAGAPKDTGSGQLRWHFLKVPRYESDPTQHLVLGPHACTGDKRTCRRLPDGKLCTVPSDDIDCDCGAVKLDAFATARQHLMAGAKLESALMLENDQHFVDSKVKPDASVEGVKMQFFMMLTKGQASRESRIPVISIESACKNNPGAQFYLYVPRGASVSFEPSLLDEIANGGCFIERVSFDYFSFFVGSPLESWLSKNLKDLRKGQYWYSHATDLFRTVALWRFGGWYLDTDVLVLKPLGGFSNTVAWEGPNRPLVNNAVSVFARQSLLMREIMHHITIAYKKKDWISAGPGAITTTLVRWPRKNCADPDCIHILSNRAFFPIAHFEPLFRPDVGDDEAARLLDGAYCIHLWNRDTKRHKATQRSIFAREYKRNCIMCAVPIEG
eukprot:scaffold7068_cov301-Pinguiococcus_pyrenoidosus.AAC.7